LERWMARAREVKETKEAQPRRWLTACRVAYGTGCGFDGTVNFRSHLFFSPSRGERELIHAQVVSTSPRLFFSSSIHSLRSARTSFGLLLTNLCTTMGTKLGVD
jgi:hypothetical protein